MRYRLVIFLFSLLFCGTSVHGQKDLKYLLKEGDLFTVQQKATQVIVQQFDGNIHEMTNDLQASYDFQVTSVNGQGFEMTLVFRNFSMLSTSNLQGEIINVNTAEVTSGDIMSAMFHVLKDYELHMDMDIHGKVLAVRGGNELIQKMIEAGGIEDGFTIELMKKSLENDFGSEKLAKSFEQMTYFYPTERVMVGDSWKNSYNGDLSAENTWTLEKMNAATTAISGVAAVVMDTENSGTVMSLSGTQETSIIAKTKSGFIEKMTVNGWVEGVSTMAQMGNVEIPTSIKSTITYQLIQD
ncbi:MAG: DUF6263 family protein [Bacteroidota bacterium]